MIRSMMMAVSLLSADGLLEHSDKIATCHFVAKENGVKSLKLSVKMTSIQFVARSPLTDDG